MNKTTSTDLQILHNILKLQRNIEVILEKYEHAAELEVSEDFDLLEYYTIRMISITKNITNKTKKMTLTFMEPEINKTLIQGLTLCYPIIAKRELIKYAIRISSETAIWEIKQVCDQLTGKIN